MATSEALFCVSSDPPRALMLSGELDLSACPALDEAIGQFAGVEGPVDVDLTNLTFMDSTGLHALVRLCSSLASGTVRLVHARTGVLKVLEMAGVPTLPRFEIVR